MRMLIANRGEIASRIIRTALRLGFETVAAYADPDRDAPHVRLATCSTRLGGSDLASSYLSIDALLSAAARTGATAVHPGYGFLSERADFARAVEAAGLTWIGPSPAAIEIMGSKIEARRLAARAGVPVIPGFDASQDDDDLRVSAERIGYPVLVKASAGGGGKGIRIASSPADFDAALREARTEAKRSFGDDAVIVERYIEMPRHIEVQIVGDRHGHVIDLGTRECSVQRRYQKVMEEAPAPNLSTDTEHVLRSSAVALAKAIGYDSTGTVEFVVDDDTGDAFFLEMNTRLQVEHPVTEAVTGLDLVELQIRVAAGSASALPAEAPAIVGHAFEARINAEDPARDFRPQTGAVSIVHVPAGARWDSGVVAGSEITPFYDSMIGKLIVHGPERDTARRALAHALDRLLIGGVRTNVGFQRWLCAQPPVVAGRVTTRFLDDTVIPLPDPERPRRLAAAAWVETDRLERACGDVWQRQGRRRFTPHSTARPVFLVDLDGATTEVLVDGRSVEGARIDGTALHWTEAGVTRAAAVAVDRAARMVVVSVEGELETFIVRTASEQWSGPRRDTVGGAGDVLAPFPAVVTEVLVQPGDPVAAGQIVVVIEAMKMLHSLAAPGSGIVAAVRVSPGEQVASAAVLVSFEKETSS
jgi:acetyl/propionyl-CoA carboxylase alpha subunit